MGVIWTGRKRFRQPGAVSVADRSNPLNRGLRGAWDIGTSLQDLSGNGAHATDASVVSTMPAVEASAGLGRARRYVPNANGGEGPRIAVPVEKFANITGSWAIVAAIRADGTGESGFGRIFDTGTGAIPSFGLNEGFFVSVLSSTALQAGNLGAATNIFSGGDLVLGKWQLLVVTYDNVSGNIAFFIDGKPSGTPAAPGAPPNALTTAGRPSIGNRSDAFFDRDWDGLLGPVFVYDRAWSFAEARSLGATAPDIYGLLTPGRRPIHFGAGAAPGALLAGAAIGVVAGTGVLSTSIRILGAAIGGAVATGALDTAISLAGASATISANASGSLTATIRLGGAAVAIATASGTLAAGAGLVGAAEVGATGAGVLTTQITLSGAAIAAALASGALAATSATLAGDAFAGVAGAGVLSTGIPLAGAASASVVGAGGLLTAIPLVGGASAAVNAAGNLVVSVRFSAVALMGAVGTGALLTSVTLNGAAVAAAVAAGVLSGAALRASPRRTAVDVARVRRCVVEG